MADAPVVPFVMHGARAAMAAGMIHIEQHIKGIERAVIENPGLAFDLAKTLIESACKAILSERNVPFAPDDDLPKLFKAAAMCLPFLPSAVSGEREARRSLGQTLGGLHTAVQGVCELRNQYGFASHGASGPRPAMETVQALFAAGAADAIVGFLHRVHRQDRLPSQHPPTEYDGNPAFNEYVDETHGLIKIFEVEFKPSEVLFQMEPETYRVYLTEFKSEADADESSSDGGGKTELAP